MSWANDVDDNPFAVSAPSLFFSPRPLAEQQSGKFSFCVSLSRTRNTRRRKERRRLTLPTSLGTIGRTHRLRLRRYQTRPLAAAVAMLARRKRPPGLMHLRPPRPPQWPPPRPLRRPHRRGLRPPLRLLWQRRLPLRQPPPRPCRLSRMRSLSAGHCT